MDKTVVVTGGSRGLGLGIAIKLAVRRLPGSHDRAPRK